MATLFVVMRGDTYEGGNCEGVYSNEQLAHAKVTDIINSSKDHFLWKKETHNYWIQDYHFVTIESWNVEGLFTKTVWLVLYGKAYEDRYINNIYGSEELARNKVVSLIEESGAQPNEPWKEMSHTSWQQGWDVLSVEEWTIDE